MNIILGSKYRDKITGFEGVATGYVTYISGCNQVLIQPPIGKDKKPGEALWLDEQRLDQVGKQTIVLDNSRASGFDAPPPVR